MARRLTDTELQDFGADRVIDYLKKDGHTVLAASRAGVKRVVQVEKDNIRYLVVINTVTYPDNGDECDLDNLEFFRGRAAVNGMILMYAGVGLVDADTMSGVITDQSPILVNFKGLKEI
jgi:hypothetical protein